MSQWNNRWEQEEQKPHENPFAEKKQENSPPAPDFRGNQICQPLLELTCVENFVVHSYSGLAATSVRLSNFSLLEWLLNLKRVISVTVVSEGMYI